MENEHRNYEALAKIIFIVFQKIMSEIIITLKEESKIWEDFENDILQNNRYFPKAKIICETLDFYSQKAVYKLQKDKSIYRARLVKSDNELPEQTKEIAESIFTLQAPFDSLPEKSDFLNPFWGFDMIDSDAPPSDKTSVGRINPLGISYLYAAEDARTALVETRPTIEQMVSVAEIEIKKDLKLFDFCANFSEGNDRQEPKIFRIIARYLSMPNYTGDVGY
jgi:hypothetical protein